METAKKLITALREELQQYGEMLARLDEQQESVLQRIADNVLRTVDSVQNQTVVLSQYRDVRERTQQETARELGLPAQATLHEINSHLPEVYRPLVNALVQENNDLLFRVQQRARQNHLLLSRSLELMQDLLGSLMPGGGGSAYTQQGSAFKRSVSAPSLYEAIG